MADGSTRPATSSSARPSGNDSVHPAAGHPFHVCKWLMVTTTTTTVHGGLLPTVLASWVAQPSDFSAQGSWWTPPAGIGSSAQPTPPAGNLEAYNLQAWGFDSHSPGDFLSFFANTSSHTQAVENGTSSQPINVGDNTNGDDCARTEKHLLWTKEEDLRLVSTWLNNSNDPIQSNYRKNEQYWKEVAAVYNSTTPKNRARLVKHVKDHFAKIKKKVAWFCASWKEANALYASGESDVDLKKRAMQTYESDHKEDGPFMFEHCWEELKEQPKWDAYLERLEDLEREKRKFSVDDEVGNHFTLDDARDERPPGGKQVKEQRKQKRKSESCIIDLEGELSKFVDAQNAANEGRKEMLETQKRVSSENLEARKLACVAAKDHKESVMLETYRSLMMQDTTKMPEDVERLLQVNESRGFPGMLGSIDCMHWRWEKCPLAWRGQFTRGDYGVPTMVLEAVASQDLHIWHAFFGVAGSNNDLNVLNQSPLFFDALKGEAPQVQFSVNGNEYTTGYYLADGIYPEWAAFMKTIPLPQTEEHKLFAQFQEAARKDVERAFGVLQSRFTVVRRPARLWKRKSVGRIMLACVILHNMIVEDEKEQAAIHIDLNENPGASIALPPEVNVGGNLCFADVLRRKAKIRARPQHTQLKNDLIQHIWHKFRNNHHN